MPKRPKTPRPDPRAGPHPLAVGLAFAVLAVAVYAPALEGPFFSDDGHYVHRNVYVQTPGLDSWIAIWSPTSIVVDLVENWAPVHLTLHAFAWRLFGPEVLGHHLFGVLMHALASTLLFLLFARTGIQRRTAIGLAALFLVHPANVEAVAWISQLKTTSSLVLALTALLLHPRRPVLALLAFALALLAKPTAAVALPTAFALGFVRGDGSWRSFWLAGWTVAFLLFAVAELAAFFETAGRAASLYPDLAERLRSHVGIALRYAVMAVSGWKLSLFHEPAAARSWLDPWWLGGLVMGLAIAARTVVVFRRRSSEGVYWLWAAVSLGPVRGIVALPYPMADRYLYFMLPGLLGAAAFAVPELWQLALRRVDPSAALRRAGAAVGVLVLLAFAFAANRHAAMWGKPESLLAHAERVYPEGQVARLRTAHRAAVAGDREAATSLLRQAIERGFDRLDVLLSDSAYRALRGDPDFDAIVDELATRIVERIEARDDPGQVELRVLAQAHFVLRDLAAAEQAYERALEQAGPRGEAIEQELENLRRERRLEAVRRARNRP